jgi:hypothetical protein
MKMLYSIKRINRTDGGREREANDEKINLNLCFFEKTTQCDHNDDQHNTTI